MSVSWLPITSRFIPGGGVCKETPQTRFRVLGQRYWRFHHIMSHVRQFIHVIRSRFVSRLFSVDQHFLHVSYHRLVPYCACVSFSRTFSGVSKSLKRSSAFAAGKKIKKAMGRPTFRLMKQRGYGSVAMALSIFNSTVQHSNKRPIEPVS